MRDQPETDLTPGRDALKLCITQNLPGIISMTKTQMAQMPHRWQRGFAGLRGEYDAVFGAGYGMQPDNMVKMEDLWQSQMARSLNEYLLEFPTSA